MLNGHGIKIVLLYIIEEKKERKSTFIYNNSKIYKTPFDQAIFSTVKKCFMCIGLCLP